VETSYVEYLTKCERKYQVIKATGTQVKQSGLLGSAGFRVAIAALISLTIAFGLEPVNGLTPMGVRAVAIIVFTVLLWLFVNTHWSCLVFSALLIMAGVMPLNEVWAGSMGNFAPTLVLVYTLLCYCLSETGAIDTVANWFITRKFVKGRPYMFMGMFFASNLIIGMLMQNLALAILYLDITVRICGKLKIEKGHSLYTCLVLGVLWGNSVLTTASPIAKTLPNMMLGILETQFGLVVSYSQWFIVGIPYSIAMFFVMMICARVMKPDVKPLIDLDIDEFSQSAPPLSKRGKISLIVVCALVLVILLPDIFLILGIFVPMANYFIQIGPTVPAILAVALLCLIRTDGEAVMDFPQAAKSVPMSLIVFIGAVVLMGIPISSDDTGIIRWLGNILQPLVAGLPPIMLLIALIAIGAFVTNFVSNAVTMVLIFNIGVVLLTGTGINITVFALLICFVCSTFSVLTPGASLQLPLFYGPGHITMANAFKINLLYVSLAFIVTVVFIPFVSAVFGA
jgi:sodium-dependent dicarboxylate transporter 2/3/5